MKPPERRAASRRNRAKAGHQIRSLVGRWSFGGVKVIVPGVAGLEKQATARSLVLLNESLSSTSAGESLYLAQDLVRILRLMGTRAVFATHLHELAASAEGLDASTAGDSRVISMVSSPIQEEEPGEGAAGLRRSYRVVVGPPMGRSYATEIATRFGVGYEQLYAMLQARGVITPAGQDETAAAS